MASRYAGTNTNYYNEQDVFNFAFDEVTGALKTEGAGGSTTSQGTYNSTTPSLTSGSTSSLQLDSSGNLKDTMGTLVAGEDLVANRLMVENRNAYNVISTAVTTIVKSGSGLLHNIVVQGGTTGTITIYDNTAASGTAIATFDTTNALQVFTFNVIFATGLTVVTSAATKLTVSYR